jgi:hypothetical protein
VNEHLLNAMLRAERALVAMPDAHGHSYWLQQMNSLVTACRAALIWQSSTMCAGFCPIYPARLLPLSMSLAAT